MIQSAFSALLRPFTSHHGRPERLAAPSRPPTSVGVIRNFVYTPPQWSQRLEADLYKPTGKGPFPAVLMIHGGGWTSGARAHMNRTAKAVARRGYVVMNISYRFAPRWRFPAQLQDVQQALLWLRANAAIHEIDVERIGTWGYSAGAHLAALVAFMQPGDRQFIDGARVSAVVAGGTPVDLSYYKSGALTNGLIGMPYDHNPQLWREASPLAFVRPKIPPVFLYHGTFDLLVGANNAHAMYGALNAASVPAEMYLIRGFGHIPTFFLRLPIERGVDFLDRHLR